MSKRGSNDDETSDYARIDREALELLKDAGPVGSVGILALHMAQDVAIASRPVHTGCIVALDEADVVLQEGEYILPTREPCEDKRRELEEMNRKPGRLANLDLRSL